MKSDFRGKDLKGQNLSGANLSQQDLSGENLFDVKLKEADLVGANLSGCDMTHCDLRGADLTKANLRSARLWGADLRGAVLSECDLSDADFWNAKLHNVKAWHTNLSGAKSIARSSFSDGRKYFPRIRINESGPAAAEESYRDLKQLFLNSGLYNDAGWASFREKVMERAVMKKKGDLNYFPSLLMNVLCGYGEKPYRIVLSAFFTILAFAFGYMLADGAEYTMGQNYAMKIVDYIYFSTITFTTVGFGDFLPRPYPLFRIMAAAEAFLGVFLSGLFIFTLARKYSAR